jgi:hypothetical protein
MQFLEEEREKRWKNKIHELEVENQKLSEEVLQARNVINDMCDSQYLESTLRRDRRIIYSSYED